MGIYPRTYLMESLGAIERVGREFLERHSGRVKKYDATQVRAVGYLHERLGSFLLLSHLEEKYSGVIPAEIFGYMTTIVESGSSYSPAKADKRMIWPNVFRLKGNLGR